MFTPEERLRLLAIKGIGPKVITRLEQLGFGSLAKLRAADAGEVVYAASTLTNTTCWRNSPQARAAIEAAIAFARDDEAA